jgi:hypothetical protein
MWTQVASPDELGDEREVWVSDTHLHPHPEAARVGAGGMNTRLLWGVEMLRRSAEIGKKYQARKVRHFGDVLHSGKTRIPSEVADLGFRALADLFMSAPGGATVLVGNHDQPDADSERTALRPLEHWPNVKLVDRLTMEGPIALIPHVRDVGKLADEVQKAALSGAEILYMHAGIEGGIPGMERDWFPGEGLLPLSVFKRADGSWRFRGAASGHFHKERLLHGGFLLYVGATQQHGWGDGDGPDPVLGCATLVDTRAMRFVRFDLCAPIFLQGAQAADVAEAKALAARVAATGRPVYLRASVPEGSKLRPEKLYEILDPVCAYVSVDDRRKAAAPPPRDIVVRSGMGDSEMLKAYLEKNPPAWVNPAEPPESRAKEIERLMGLGLGYLAKGSNP